MNRSAQPITLLICALGGEGGGVLTDWLVHAAQHAGYPVQATSIPGVAQRTGATTYYLEVFPQRLAELNGKKPVLSLNPVPGALDAMVSSELLETTRQIANGMATQERTCVITSNARALTTAERTHLGDGRIDPAALLAVVQAHSREHHVLDMNALAREAGTVVSAVMLGAVAASGLLPFAREAFETAIADGAAPDKLSKAAQASLRGFAKGFEAVSQPRQQALDLLNSLLKQELFEQVSPGLPADLAHIFPLQVHPMLTLGHARLLDYQGPAYAALYVQRLQQVLAAEKQADPSAAHAFATTTEMARWLALWMAFDDIVRVADLKSRASRWARVRSEVKAQPGDLLKVFDHFKPGVPELAALLPTGLANQLLRWDARRTTAGKTPWALPLKVGSHSVIGMLALRTLAACKRLRPLGSRYAMEQAMIDQWLQAVVTGSQRGWQLGHEIALCGRLIKGYGATNERAKHNLLHVLQHLAPLPDPLAAASAIAAARTAALADEAGKALDATLVQHGAPKRPVKEQPIRFVRKPGGAGGKATV